jgi:hypothetical protein
MASVPERPQGTDLGQFIGKQARLPHLSDEVAPWHYRGWLLPYVILIQERCSGVGDRWGYHLRTLEAGRLLDEPIPQLIIGRPDAKVFTLLRDWSTMIGGDCGGWSDFRTLLEWILWGLALSNDEPKLSEQVNEKLYRAVNVGPLLEHPYDYMGDFVVQDKANGWNPTAFYPTPHHVVELMVRMSMSERRMDGRDLRTICISDPCAGSGRMLLHASNYSLNLHGQDIDPVAVAMCKINGALYAPWLAFPLPASILKATETETPPGNVLVRP